ncbi:hypothetical protein HUO13_11950 [Saccharopolyspora erythraea]|uniref:hypothetical protein n=1 Tax=Saccharopolyspora erythraea TaxID=1836 RepID=UPI001BAB03B3|nr:hypothetical protein [Saccharopolyspora erythraea]QUH01428.1 hypothetical protein HUO13_11950 [Saccharopolyspora erythraea]
MAAIVAGRPEVTHDQQRRTYVWRCWVVSLSGLVFTRCYATGHARTEYAATVAAYAHFSACHKES